MDGSESRYNEKVGADAEEVLGQRTKAVAQKETQTITQVARPSHLFFLLSSLFSPTLTLPLCMVLLAPVVEGSVAATQREECVRASNTQ